MMRSTVIPRQIDLTHLQPSDRYGAYAIVRNLLPLFMLLALAPILADRSIAAAWSLAPLVGLFLYRITIVMHDCVHRTLFRSPRVNDCVGMLLGAMTGIDLRRFRALHGKHHRLYGRAEDPQGFHDLGVQRLTRVQFAWHLVKPLFGANLRYVWRESMLHPENLWRALRRGDAAVFLSVQFLMFGVVTGGGRYLYLALLPFVSAATLGLFLSQLRGLAEHGSRSAVEQAGHVRSHSARALERLLLYDLHFNYREQSQRLLQQRMPGLQRRHAVMQRRCGMDRHSSQSGATDGDRREQGARSRAITRGRRCGSDACRRGSVRSALESDASSKNPGDGDTDDRNQSARRLGVQRVCSWVVQMEPMARPVVAGQALPSRGSIRFGRTVR
jgi:fatty acid desaturase